MMTKVNRGDVATFSRIIPHVGYCIVCNKLVEKIKHDYDFLNDTHRIVFYCHGNKEIIDVPSEEYENILFHNAKDYREVFNNTKEVM